MFAVKKIAVVCSRTTLTNFSDMPRGRAMNMKIIKVLVAAFANGTG